MKKYIVLIASLALFISCNNEKGKWNAPNLEVNKSTFIDERDGSEYKCITVNGQTWMAENLKYRLDLGAVDGCYTYEDEMDTTRLKNAIAAKIRINKAEFSARVKVLCPGAYVFPTTILSNMWMMNYHDYFCKPNGSYYNSSYVKFESEIIMPQIIRFIGLRPTLEPELTDFLLALRLANKEQEDSILKTKLGEHYDPQYAADFGYLYSYANIQKVIPKGWRLPSDEDWKKLELSLGMTSAEQGLMEQWRGDGCASLLKIGDDGCGFDAKFAGCGVSGLIMSGSSYRSLGFKAYYWTSSTSVASDGREFAIIRTLQYNNDGIYRGKSLTSQAAYSIRLIKE